MSLEHAISQNTAAILDLIATIKAGAAAAPIVVPAPAVASIATDAQRAPAVEAAPTPVTAEVTDISAVKSKKRATPAAAAEPVAEENTSAGRVEKTAEIEHVTPPAAEPPAVTVQDVGNAILAFARATSKADALALLKRFGADKVSQLAPSDYASVVAAIEAAQAEVA